MAYWCDGVIELSREEFEQTIEIAFAAGSDDAPPQRWADKPLAIVEWEE